MTAGPRQAGRWTSAGEWVPVGIAVLSVLVVALWVDLTPRVESEFFFAQSDPQLQASLTIERRFPSQPQIIVRAEAPDVDASAYSAAIADLTADLEQVPGIISAYSIANQDAVGSPLWSRLLRTPDGAATNIILSTDGTDPAALIPRVEAAVARHAETELDLRMSGAPYVVELIRRSLLRDLITFSSAALVIFGLAIGGVYRQWRIVLGALTACLTACALTLSLAQLSGIAIGLLTANITTIVFVITLSHVVFLTSNWQAARAGAHATDQEPVGAAVRTTIVPSFWCMFTTLCGFVSLLLSAAKPLRELGMAGAIGTLTALAVAYGLYPAFLRGATTHSRSGTATTDAGGIGALLPRAHARRWLITLASLSLLAGIGVRRLSTDPSLLSYFARGSAIRAGLDTVDRDGGSSALYLAVEDGDGGPLDTDAAYDRMWSLQQALEADPSVGVVLSPALLLADAKRAPLASFLDWRQLLAILESPRLNQIALSFITADHSQGLFFLRMREGGRNEPRADVIARLTEAARGRGLDVVLAGGLYDLQAKLGHLIARSLRTAIGGLLLLFIAVAFVVSRGVRASAVMVACLTAIPFVILGTLGHARVPLDMIASPAVNVSLAMGVDSMIHLAVRARRLRSRGADPAHAWFQARAQLWRPILGASLIICAGFGIFSLSEFPPTQRFGLAVILGTVTAAAFTLIAVPLGAARGSAPPRAATSGQTV